MAEGLRIAQRYRVVVDNDWAGDPDGLVALAHHLLSPGHRVEAVTSSLLSPMFGPPEGGAAAGAALAVELIGLVGGVGASGPLGAGHWPGPGQWWLYLGGPLGAAITVCAAWAIRHLGTFALTLGVVVGQMVTAVLVDLLTGVPTRWATLVAVLLVTGATLLVVVPRRAVATVPR